MAPVKFSLSAGFFVGLFLSTASDIAHASTEPLKSEREARRESVLEAYYGAPSAQTVWLSQPQRLRALDALLRSSARHGLDPTPYLEALEAARAGDLSAAQSERQLSAVFLAYADHVSAGRLDPAELDARVHFEPEPADLPSILYRFAGTGDPGAFLDALGPQDAAYEALMMAASRLRAQHRAGGWGEPIVLKGVLSPGSSSPKILDLRRKLIALGDLDPSPEFVLASVNDEEGGQFAQFDERLEAAVRRFQARHGIPVDGAIGPQTLAALNVPLLVRLTQIYVNMERLRWHSGAREGQRIEVNTADFRLKVFGADERVLHETRVIVGKEGRRYQTPEFADSLSYLVFNPTWTVPPGILRREILPALEEDPSFLRKNDMMLLRDGDPLDPAEADFANMRAELGRYRVVQRPGDENALGHVKFMFPNEHNVYLHDTPTKDLFAKDRRAFSHGCVRVERPFALAWLLLSQQEADPGAFIDAQLTQTAQKWISLDTPIPIRLMYQTAWVDEEGVLQFRDDIYRRDVVLAEALYQGL